MKKSPSLNSKMRELAPLLVSRMTPPVHTPCQTPIDFLRIKKTVYPEVPNFNQKKRGLLLLTITRAVMDSLIHRFSSRRWPMTMQAQSRDTNKVMELIEP